MTLLLERAVDGSGQHIQQCPDLHRRLPDSAVGSGRCIRQQFVNPESVVGDPLNPGTEVGPMAFAPIGTGCCTCIDRPSRTARGMQRRGHDPVVAAIFVAPTVLAVDSNDLPIVRTRCSVPWSSRPLTVTRTPGLATPAMAGGVLLVGALDRPGIPTAGMPAPVINTPGPGLRAPFEASGVGHRP